MVEENRTEESKQTSGSDEQSGIEVSHEESSVQEESEKTEVDFLNEELEKFKIEAKENYDKFLRATAEFENLRRRTEKERGDLLRFGAENLMKDILQVVDSFNKALPDEDSDIASHNPDEFLKGMQLVWKQMTEVLSKNGLNPIETKDVVFDPNYHQAIQRIESDDIDSEVIADEFQKGYLLHDRLLRPSMVSVKVPK